MLVAILRPDYSPRLASIRPLPRRAPALTKPLGLYLVQVLDPRGRTWLDRSSPARTPHVPRRGIDPDSEQSGWRAYTFAAARVQPRRRALHLRVLRFAAPAAAESAASPRLSPALAFNTAVSFTTNTNWQSYGGESTMSYFSQMVGLTLHNFVSAAAGIAVAAALVRGLARSAAKTLGNFWVRPRPRHLLPARCPRLRLVSCSRMILVSQGLIQNFRPYTDATHARRRGHAAIAQGPMASQVAIKMLGTNGGGFTNANAAHPFENPTPLSNFLQMLAIFAIRSGLTYYLGRMVKNQRHGWAVWAR
jgi:K+-transporting ATPase ATPase A chain